MCEYTAPSQRGGRRFGRTLRARGLDLTNVEAEDVQVGRRRRRRRED